MFKDLNIRTLSTIRNGEHIAYIIDKNNEIEESHKKMI